MGQKWRSVHLRGALAAMAAVATSTISLHAGPVGRSPAPAGLKESVRKALAEDLPGLSTILLIRSSRGIPDDSARSELDEVILRFRRAGRPLSRLPSASAEAARLAAGPSRHAIAVNASLYRQLSPFFEAHGFDCNERVLIHLDAARKAGLPLPVYARSLNHAGLLFESAGLVLDPFDGLLRTISEFAVGSGYGGREGYEEGYFVRWSDGQCLVNTDQPPWICRELVPEERPDPVDALEPYSSLLLDAAAAAEDPQGALAFAVAAVEIDPGSSDAHDTYAGLAMDRGAFALAAAHYSAALDLNRNDARIHYNRGVSLQFCGQRENAVAEYREALALQPRMTVALENLGVMLAAWGPDREEGLRLLESALAGETSRERLGGLRNLIASLRKQLVPEVAPSMQPPGMPLRAAVRTPSEARRSGDRP